MFCSCLDNSTFFTDLEIQLPSNATRLNNSTAVEFIHYIDDSSEKFISQHDPNHYHNGRFQRETQYTESFIGDALQRGVCLTVAQGMVERFYPLVKEAPVETKVGRILRTLDAEIAMPFLYHHRPEIKVKPRYTLAYLLLVHNNLPTVIALIDALDDPTVYIYIHVDFNAPNEFREALQELAHNRTNIAVMPTAFSVIWGHATLLWAQIRGFFDLLDLIEFEYVINLSGSDYPLKSAETIYRALEEEPGNNWMDWTQADSWRVDWMYQCGAIEWDYMNLIKQCFDFGEVGVAYRPWDSLVDIFPERYKSSQWLILHRSTVEYLRTSDAVAILMMWAEHLHTPDEMIPATLLASSPFRNSTFRGSKRLIIWPEGGGEHPYQLWYFDEDLIEQHQRDKFFVRKVDVVEDPRLKGILDAIRERDEMSITDRPFGFA